ncbi:transposable element Tc1 transposase [Trichonephila clavipes]|nr:transposable element Tc1 transposase [Trichonephila clavipes]
MHVHMSPRLSNPYLDSQQVQLLSLACVFAGYVTDGTCVGYRWGRLARDLRAVVSTDELWLRIQTIWNTLPQTDIQNLFKSMPRRVAALIAARGSHTKY